MDIYPLLKKSYDNNHDTPINSLPDELLRMIFALSSDEKAECSMLDRIQLTWVCRRWRFVAIDTAELWRYIDLDCQHFSMVQEVLARSKLAPLEIKQGSDDAPNFNQATLQIKMLEKLISPHFSRIESLSLGFSTPRWQDIRGVLTKEAPALKRLSLSKVSKEVHGWAPGRTLDIYTKAATLPTNLFNGVAPLESFSFSMPQPPPWNSLVPLIPYLRNLTLITATYDRWSTAMLHLFDALRVCSQLEFLCLDTMLAEDADEDIIGFNAVPVPVPVALPKLSRLVLQSTKDAYILPYLATPALKQLYLALDEEIDGSLLAAVTDHIDMKAMQEVTLGNGGAFLARSGLCPTSDWSDLHYTKARPDENLLSIAFYEDMNNGSCFLTLLSSCTNADRLVLREGPLSDKIKASWPPMTRDILASAKSIRELVISLYDDIRPILRTLEDPTLCPQLTRLVCIGGLHFENYVGTELVSLTQARGRGKSSAIQTLDVVYCPKLDRECRDSLCNLGAKAKEQQIKNRVNRSRLYLFNHIKTEIPQMPPNLRYLLRGRLVIDSL